MPAITNAVPRRYGSPLARAGYVVRATGWETPGRLTTLTQEILKVFCSKHIEVATSDGAGGTLATGGGKPPDREALDTLALHYLQRVQVTDL